VLDKLFPFQLEDVKYLAKSPNVADFSEMGTGKTYKGVALDYVRRTAVGQGATLVVAPLPVLDVWAEHFQELTGLKVRVIDPKRRHELLRYSADVYGVHWEGLRLLPELRETTWLHIIADECQKMKNRKAKQTKALKQLSAGYRTALTGTPVINKPDDLWSILNWLYPRKHAFKAYWRFFHKFTVSHLAGAGCELTDERGELLCSPNQKKAKYHITHGPQNEEELQALIRPFTVRRLKKDVLTDLPDKYYTTIKVSLSTRQRRMYDDMKEEMLAWVGPEDGQPLLAPVAIAKLVRLQQITLATPYFRDEDLEAFYRAVQYAENNPDDDKKIKPPPVRLEEPSSKLDALIDKLQETDRKVVVWTQFKQFADLICTRLRVEGISYTSLTGSETGDERKANIQSFQRCDDPRVLVGTIKTGGVGITLTAADTVFFLDRDWSPANNDQAEDRLHRHGQVNAVQVIDIVAANTVDQPRGRKLDLKKSWIRSVLGDH
jgi:SNF2 family DNA or RNA helicase